MPDQTNPMQKRPADPREKSGMPGAFCRVYGIHETIRKFLPGVYVPFENKGDRYTYAGGSSQGGATVYEDLFLNSFHSSDPCSGKLTSANKIDDALGLCAHRHSINDVKEYLDSLEWDGTGRVDSLLIDYFGAADTQYVRAVTRKALTAAVARTMTPGVKYDWVLILVGPQGIGKSTLLRLLGKKWYSDSLTSFEGKDASEMIQGTWINELGELSTLNHSETNIAKQFLSRTEDIYREPFGKRTKRYPRRCVFFGTSNESEFLKDATGERRFWPVTLKLSEPIKDVFSCLSGEVDQIWAEARTFWLEGEPLHLPHALEAEARDQQELYRESNAKEGIIREFIDMEIPMDWDKRTLSQRREYWNNTFEQSTTDKVPRYRICAAEIWCECFSADIKFIKRRDSIEINKVLAKLEGWRRYQGRFGIYNQQKGYERQTWP